MRPASALRRLSRRSPAELALLAEALALLAFASFAIRFLPFRAVARLADVARRRRSPAPAGPSAWAVAAAARRVPWKALCIQQGLALHWMLRRRGVASILHYGIGRRGEGISAHAWVTVAGEIVLGAPGLPGHVAVARFPADAD